MLFKDLKVGQIIQADEYSPDDIGIITRIKDDRVYVNWYLQNPRWACICTHTDTLKEWILIEPTPYMTPEEKVKARIKKLWNKSNWVKANPSQAYS